VRWILITLVIANIGFLAWQFVPHKTTKAISADEPTLSEQRDDITLLRETDRSASIELQQLVDRPIIKEPRQAGEQGCRAIGPFLSIYESQNIVNQLGSVGVHLQARAVDQPTGEYDYRLLIPPLNSLEEAFRKLRELQASHIDSYVITAGKDALGISLGVFSTRQGAEVTMKQIELEGFKTEMVKISRLSRTYWLFDRPGSLLDIQADTWQKLKSSNPDIQKTELPCE